LLSVLGDVADNSKVSSHGQRNLSRKMAYTADFRTNHDKRGKKNPMYTDSPAVKGSREDIFRLFFQFSALTGASQANVQPQNTSHQQNSGAKARFPSVQTVSKQIQPSQWLSSATAFSTAKSLWRLTRGFYIKPVE